MFACAAVALVAVLWWATAGALDRQTDAAIRADAIALSERWREPAMPAGRGDRGPAGGRCRERAIYLMMDAGTGRRIAGHLDSWPPGQPKTGPWFHTPLQR